MIPAGWDKAQPDGGLLHPGSEHNDLGAVPWENHSSLGSKSSGPVHALGGARCLSALAALPRRLSLWARQHLFIPLALAEASAFAHQSDEMGKKGSERVIKTKVEFS